jgi:hypothetical protein
MADEAGGEKLAGLPALVTQLKAVHQEQGVFWKLVWKDVRPSRGPLTGAWDPKTAAQQLAEAGGSNAELEALFGWSPDAMAAL